MIVSGRTVLIVSHACVVPENQSVYVELRRLGWNPVIVAPARWQPEYKGGVFDSQALAGLEARLVPIPVLLRGRPQRHIYLCSPRRLIRRLEPDVVFVEEEPFSIPALQWAAAAVRAAVPFGLQCAETLDRPLPLPARAIRRWTLGRARFVAARSPTAAALAGKWGATGEVAVVPHAVPTWNETTPGANGGRPFTIGFAGRLVPEKGVLDLARAARLLGGPARLLLVGDGPLRAELQSEAPSPDLQVEIRSGVTHDRMRDAYADMDVLVLPSRTTRSWAEQFGRVLVEALSCGIPVVGSTSGEIPWVVSSTGGGLLFQEGAVDQLADVLRGLRDDPLSRRQLASAGR